MTNKLKIHKGLTLGEGQRAVLIEEVNSENIYLRLQNDSQRRIIPTQLILDLLSNFRKLKKQKLFVKKTKIIHFNLF